MLALLRQLNGAAVGFLVVLAGVAFCLSLRDPAGDVFPFTLITSLLAGAVVGIPLGVGLARRLPPWPQAAPNFLAQALVWGSGGLALVYALSFLHASLALWLALPVLWTSVEFAAQVTRLGTRLRAALTLVWLGLVVWAVLGGFAVQERRRVAAAQRAELARQQEATRPVRFNQEAPPKR